MSTLSSGFIDESFVGFDQIVQVKIVQATKVQSNACLLNTQDTSRSWGHSDDWCRQIGSVNVNETNKWINPLDINVNHRHAVYCKRLRVRMS